MNVSVGLDTATIAKDSSFLIRLISLVVSVKRDSCQLLIWTNCSDEHRARIANVRAENFGSNDKDGDTSGPTEAQVDFGVAYEGVLDGDEAAGQLIFHFGGVDDSLRDLCLVKCVLDRLLNVVTQLRLHKV